MATLRNALADFQSWYQVISAFDPKQGGAPLCVPLLPGIAHAERAEFEQAGFRFSPDDPHYGSTYAGEHVIKVDFSTHFSHRAVMLSYAEWPGALLWVDGRSVDAPADSGGYPLIDCPGRWIDERTFTASVGGLNHPLADPSVNDPLGAIRGLLIYDAARQSRVLALPGPDEAWNSPVALRDQGKILVYANAAARDQRRDPRAIEG